jgi:hypothetical protein
VKLLLRPQLVHLLRMKFFPVVLEDLLDFLRDIVQDVAVEFMGFDANISPQLMEFEESSFEFLLHVCELVHRDSLLLFGDFDRLLMEMAMNFGVVLEV